MKIDVSEIVSNEISKKDVEKYLNLVSIVKNSMKFPEWLGDFSKQDCVDIIENSGSIVMFSYNDISIGAGLLIPSTQKDLKKFLSDDLNYEEVIDFGPQMVNPEYLGNGIQKLIISTLEKISKNKGYKYVLTTVHPDNIFSINNLIKSGFTEVGNILLKRGPRNVYRKKIVAE